MRSAWRLQALAIAAAEDVGRNHELIAAHFRLPGYLVGIDVDQLHHPVGVRAAGRGDQIGDRLPADLHRRGQHVGDERHDIGAAGRFALIVHQPFAAQVMPAS
jgi:hypothetical protein